MVQVERAIAFLRFVGHPLPNVKLSLLNLVDRLTNKFFSCSPILTLQPIFSLGHFFKLAILSFYPKSIGQKQALKGRQVMEDQPCFISFHNSLAIDQAIPFINLFYNLARVRISTFPRRVNFFFGNFLGLFHRRVTIFSCFSHTNNGQPFWSPPMKK